MNKQKSIESVYFEQSDISAFIYQVLNLPPKPELRQDGKVVFRFDVDISDALQKFYSNELIPIQDYCQKLKTVRSMIFAVKGGRGYGKQA